jgi:hypothetical protein
MRIHVAVGVGEGACLPLGVDESKHRTAGIQYGAGATIRIEDQVPVFVAGCW